MCVSQDTHIGTRYVILANNWIWLPDDGFMWTETCWRSFYNFNYFNNLRILQFVCISWKIKCLILLMHGATVKFSSKFIFNTLRTGDADLRFYITNVQDGWRKSAFLTSACFPCAIDLIMQYIEPVSGWFCWRIFIQNWPHSELNFRHRASSI